MSRGERSLFQKGNNSQITQIFFYLLNPFNPFRKFCQSNIVIQIMRGRMTYKNFLEKQDTQFRTRTNTLKDPLNDFDYALDN